MSEDTTKNPATGEIEDVHASRIDPNDSRLKLSKPAGRSLKKGPVIGILAAVIGVVMIAFAFALQPPKQQVAQEDEQVEIAEQILPDNIRSIPDTPGNITASTPDDVPPLGRPLPGDLGAAMIDQPENAAGQNGYSQQKSPDEQAYEKALTAGVSFGSSGSGYSAAMPSAGVNPASMLSAYADKIAEAQKASNPFAAPDPNGQDSKNDFYNGASGDHKEYVSGGVKKALSPYEIKAGTIIPASLVTGLNSDLPGDVIAQVRENVYDTVSGNYLLIPQGSKLIGKYNSRVTYGQKRAQVAWTRLIRPDGSSISLESMPGVDLAGYSGFSDKVDNHFDRLLGGVLLSSVLSVGTTASAGNYDSYEDRSLSQVFAANAGDEMASAGNKITRKNLDIQPTIKIRPGFSVNVLVNKDMIVPPFNSKS